MGRADSTFLIEYERLRSVFQHAPLTLSVTVLNAIVTVGVLAPNSGGFDWLGAIIMVSAIRWIGGRRFLHQRPGGKSYRKWTMFSVLGALTTGVLWGGGASAWFPALESHQFFLSLVVGGMCAGAVTVNAAHLPTVLSFILPASLPFASRLVAEGPAWRMSALMVVVFAAALSAISLGAHRAFGERIRLRLALDLERRKLSEANERLRDEVVQRRSVEATLHQAQKMEAIGHLTGGIAHDFNNLLQVMIGNINLIQRLSGDNVRIAECAWAVEQAAMRGAELTSSLLSFARRQTLRAEPVDINALLQEFRPILLHALGGMVRCELILAPLVPRCRVDAAHFQSAILNLVINARDAMPDGGTLSVTTGVVTLTAADLLGNADAGPGDFVLVAVKDTGFGMSAAVMARVFEPFFTTKQVGKGSGLGLSQVYGFARQSGGHIGLVSKPGEGTEAKLFLPVSRVDRAMRAGQAAIEDTAVEATAIEDGAIDDGAIEDGAIEDGAIDDGAIEDGAIDGPGRGSDPVPA